MRSLSMRDIATIIISLNLALILSIMPLPDWLVSLRPQWLALMVIYWEIDLPQKIGLGTAWILGLLLDGLYGSLLGEHALALSVIAYFANRFHRQIRMFPLAQQSLVVFILVAIYQALLLWIQGVIGELMNPYWAWLSVLMSMFFWPLIFSLLRSSRSHATL